MKPLHWIVGLALLWAQEKIYLPVEIEQDFLLNLQEWQNKKLLRARQRSLSPLHLPQMRTTNLPWLLPNQNVKVVPSTNITRPDFAGDTLLANGVGSNVRDNPPQGCVGTFFDSLEANFAYPAFGIERDTIQTVQIGNRAYYLCTNGGVAERYDIVPRRDSPRRRVAIKGVAALILNYSAGNGCEPTTAAPAPEYVEDGAYTLIYAIMPSQNVRRWPFFNPPRSGTKPADSLVRVQTKPLSEVRLANVIKGQRGPSCPEPTRNQPDYVVQLLDFAYFSQPLIISDSASYYVSVMSEIFNRKTFNLRDTLHFCMGPGSALPPDRHPCLTADTVQLGRSVFSVGLYDTTNGSFIGVPVMDTLVLDWVPVGGLARQLNFIVFPIIYDFLGEPTSLGSWIRAGTQNIMTPYPNPTTDCFHLRFESEESTTVHAYLYTPDGRLVKSYTPQSISAGEAQLTLDVQDVPLGTYVLRVESELGRAVFQVTILR